MMRRRVSRLLSSYPLLRYARIARVRKDDQTMSRAWIIYILMFAVLAGGLWVILEAGGAIRAPDDLAGEWTLVWLTSPPPNGGDVPPLMRIDQSGRFFQVQFGQAKPIPMTLRHGWRGLRDGPRLDMQLAGGAWTMKIDGDIPPKSTRAPQVNVELIGPTRHVGRASLRGYEAPATRPAATGVARAR
jgi:hypothetical protein